MHEHVQPNLILHFASALGGPIVNIFIIHQFLKIAQNIVNGIDKHVQNLKKNEL